MIRFLKTIPLVLMAGLTGCFLSPGAFSSVLSIDRDGGFSFDYQGEIVLAVDDSNMGFIGNETYTPEAEEGAEQLCWDGEDGQRPCTAEELDQRRARTEQMREREARSRASMMAMLGGIDPTSDESMRAFAARLSQQVGWRSVVYRGDGVFEVDYAMSGMLDRGFVFPVLPGFEVIQPMVILSPRRDRTVRMEAPAFAPTAIQFPSVSPSPLPPRTDGTFQVITDGEILTNNTDSGPARAEGRSVLSWRVDGARQTRPEALIRLDAAR